MSLLKPTKRYVLFCLVLLFLTLFLPAIQEEPIYLLYALGTHITHNYINLLDLAADGGYFGNYSTILNHIDMNTVNWPFQSYRPPLLTWLIVIFSHVFGFEYLIVYSRFITAISTALITFILYRLMKILTNNKEHSYIACAVYLSWSLLIKFGWLAYADQLQTLGVMISIYGLWVATEKKNNWYFILAGIGVVTGFLSKSLVPFIIYGAVGLSLLIFHPNRRFLLKYKSIIIGLLTFCTPLIWSTIFGYGFLHSMIDQIMHGEQAGSTSTWLEYLRKILYDQPIGLVTILFPLGFIALYNFFIRKRLSIKYDTLDLNHIRISIVAFLILFFPTWFTVNQGFELRYWLPYLPLLSIAASYYIIPSTDKVQRFATKLLYFMIVIKVLAVIGMYIFYYGFRLNYSHIGKDIVKQSQGNVIYIINGNPSYNNCGWSKLLINGVDIALMKDRKQLATYYNSNFKTPKKYYISCFSPSGDKPKVPANATIIKKYSSWRQGGEKVYLIKVQK